VLAEYRFRPARINPFLEAGPSIRRPDSAFQAWRDTRSGGVEFRWRAARTAPALRLTRWGGAPGQNEADVVVIVLFGGATLPIKSSRSRDVTGKCHPGQLTFRRRLVDRPPKRRCPRLLPGKSASGRLTPDCTVTPLGPRSRQAIGYLR
jgi:hypothetical protein